MTLFIIGLISLLVCIVVIAFLNKKIAKKKEEYKSVESQLKKQQSSLKDLETSFKTLANQCDEARSVFNNLQKISKDYDEQINERQKQLNAIIESGTQSARASVDAFAQEYKKNQIAKVHEEEKALREKLEITKQAWLEQIEPIRKELEEYQKEQAAIIESRKREQELRDNREFHSVVLSQNAIDDIGYISSILDRVHKPEVVAKVVWEVYIQSPTKDMLNRVIGKDKKTGIYKITNVDTSESYIGQGVDVAKRLTEHIKGTLGIQSIADQKIHHAMAEVGLQNWTFELLEECKKEELNQREKFYINYYKSNEFGYNRTSGG
jgi:hypothetical protein